MSSWSVKVKYEMNISNEDSLLPDFKSVGKSHLVLFFLIAGFTDFYNGKLINNFKSLFILLNCWINNFGSCYFVFRNITKMVLR